MMIWFKHKLFDDNHLTLTGAAMLRTVIERAVAEGLKKADASVASNKSE
jgi:hypothetical protein